MNLGKVGKLMPFISSAGAGAGADIVFESSWKTNNAGTSNDDQISLPLEVSGTYDFNVDWGDESSDTITVWNQAEVTHTYASPGTYTVTITVVPTTGIIQGWRFNNAGDKLKILTVESWGDLLVGNNGGYFYGCDNLVLNATDKLAESIMTVFENGFRDCRSMVSITEGLFDNNPLIYTFRYCFRACPIEEIPEGLFDNQTTVNSFYACFRDCTDLLAIPAGLFDNNVTVTTFSHCFYACPITVIPEGLFDNNVNVIVFEDTFEGTLITEIPEGLFDLNVAVTTFAWCFCGTLITAIPAGLFDNNVLVTTFDNCFNWNDFLVSIPARLFDYNTDVLSFEGCFCDCPELTGIPSGLFDNNTIVNNFGYCFYMNGANDLTGLAPTLWLREPEPTGTSCFYNCLGLSNYCDIPGTWK